MKKHGMRGIVMIGVCTLAMMFAGQMRAQQAQPAIQSVQQSQMGAAQVGDAQVGDAQVGDAQVGDAQAQVGTDRKIDPAKLAALKAKIETLKYEKLKTNLGLDATQAKQFFEVYKPAEQEIQGLVQQRNADLLKLHQISNGSDNSGDAEATLTEIHDLTQKIEGSQQSLDQNLKPILSPRQRAQLLVFEQEFNRKVGEAVRKHRIERRLGDVHRKLQELRKQRQRLRKQLQKQ